MKNTRVNEIIEHKVLVAVILFIGLFTGWLLFSGSSTPPVHTVAEHDSESIYTCSMHPQVRLDEPGQCPICFMDLIPLSTEGSDIGPRELKLSESAVALAKISTTPVRRGPAQHTLKLAGRIEYDETRIKNISAWFPGRLERLFVDYTGIRVNRGDHLYNIYSPELYATQEELLQAQNRLERSGSGIPKSVMKNGFMAAREKARLLGLSDIQVEQILSNGKAEATLQVNSPISGVVTKKAAMEGSYIKTGEEIYTITDLSHVWLILEAYEQDLPWIAYGQQVSFQVTGLPGKTFQAQISYIDPLVDAQTRSVTVRAVLDNSAGLFKPGMLARSEVFGQLNVGGEIIRPDLTGKWTCPMHPEVLSEKSGICDICEMDLVPVQKSNSIVDSVADPLLIPRSAVLRSSGKSLVFVRTNHSEGSLFELREILLGPKVGDEYLVLSGLEVGEQVVSEGNFKIDSAMQIAGKTSLMSLNPVKELKAVSPAQQETLNLLLGSYLDLQGALARDDVTKARVILQSFLEQIDSDLLESPIGSKRLNEVVQLRSATLSTLVEIRSAFEGLSKWMIELQNETDLKMAETLYEAFCPMAFDNQGASWLQTSKEVNNPYFGNAMLRCGDVTQTHLGQGHAHE